MSVGHLSAHNQSLAADVQAVVVRLVRQQGVPVTVAQASKLAERLYPSVVRARESAYRAHMVELGRQAMAAGVELRAELLEDYPPKALFDAVCQIARLTPGATNIRVDLLDKETGELVSTPVMPSADNRHDRVVVDRVAAELSRRVSRHVVQAGRQGVASTIHNGSARFAASGRPAHAGYARVLTGRENCAFCTMLASRGPVYREDTVVRRKDGRRYHDGCDCIPVLVVDGHPWEGEDAYRKLEKRWRDLTWHKDDSGEPTGPGSYQWAKWRAHIEGGKLNAKDFAVGAKPSRRGTIELNGVRPASHEMVTYEFLQSQGRKIELIPRSNVDGVKTPDCLVDGKPTEVKAPEGSSKETVYRLIREAKKQSPRVIVDMHRTKLTVEQVLAQVAAAMRRYTSVEQVIVITPERTIIERSRADG